MATLKGLSSLAKDVGSRAKRNALKGVGNAVFGSGVVGGALNKAFQKKFSEQDSEDTRVTDALETQTNVQDNNSAILTRIESIVMNIADNVYNLAGIMNANVVSMKEAQRLQQERAFKEAAAAEEANSEKGSEKIGGPDAAAGNTPTKKGGIGETLKGLAQSIGSTKTLMKGFLKKFGVMAVGLTAALGTAAYMGWDDSKEQGGGPAQGEGGEELVDVGGIMLPQSQAAQVSNQGSSSTIDYKSPGSVTSKASVAGVTKGVPVEAPKTAAEMGTSSSSVATSPDASPVSTPQSTTLSAATEVSPGATPVSSPPSVSATPLPEASSNASLEELEQRKNTIKKAIYSTKALIRTAEKLGDQDQVQRNEQFLKEVLVPGLAKTEDLITKVSPSGSSSSGGSISSGAATTSSVPSAPSPSPRPMAASPSSGASVGAASTSVAAASEPVKKQPSVQSFENTIDTSRSMTLSIPSPVANRGSLDIGIEFSVEA